MMLRSAGVPRGLGEGRKEERKNWGIKNRRNQCSILFLKITQQLEF
jgi:hypothetical protein